MLQFRIVHCIQDVGKQVLDEEERGIAKQLRILDQGNRIAFAIIGDYAFCRIRLELLIVLWIVLINDIANFCRVAVVVAIDFHLVFDDRFVCIVQQHLDFGRNVDSPFGLSHGLCRDSILSRFSSGHTRRLRLYAPVPLPAQGA